jgi:hypothetical protein
LYTAIDFFSSCPPSSCLAITRRPKPCAQHREAENLPLIMPKKLRIRNMFRIDNPACKCYTDATKCK